MQALNFSHKAIVDLMEISLAFEARGVPKSAKIVKDICRDLYTAPKFIIPDTYQMISQVSVPDDQDDLADAHLPFPAVVLEYRVQPMKHLPADREAFSDRILLLWEMTEKTTSPATKVAWEEHNKKLPGLLFTLMLKDQGGQWAPHYAGGYVPFSKYGEPLQVATQTPDVTSIGFDVMNMLPEVYEKLEQKYRQQGYSMQKILETHALDIMEDINIGLRFLLACSCSNVTHEVAISNARINRKRRKQGKLPMFDYKALKIDPTKIKKRPITTTERGDERRSPRWHKRRGHIRFYASGKKTWVSPCEVGDRIRGTIKKDYLFT